MIDKDYNFSFFGNQENEDDSGKKKISTLDLISGLYRDQGELSEQKAWMSILLIFIFTIMTIYMVQNTRKDAKLAMENFYQDMSKYKD